MSLRTLNVMVVTVALASLPVLSSAADVNPMMQSCVKAFLAKLAVQPDKAVKVRFEREPETSGLTMDRYDQLLLTARGSNHHRMIAQATCRADSHGRPILEGVSSP